MLAMGPWPLCQTSGPLADRGIRGREITASPQTMQALLPPGATNSMSSPRARVANIGWAVTRRECIQAVRVSGVTVVADERRSSRLQARYSPRPTNPTAATPKIRREFESKSREPTVACSYSASTTSATSCLKRRLRCRTRHAYFQAGEREICSERKAQETATAVTRKMGRMEHLGAFFCRK